MSNRSNYVVVITSLLSSAFRLLLVWPGVVLAIFGLIFFIATLCDNGAQKAASRMADTAQDYRAAPAGMVMVRTCLHPDDPVWDISTGPAAAPVIKRDCKPHPKTFADVARQERRIILWIGSVLIGLGMLVELFYLLYRRRQMNLNVVYGSINARGEYRAVTYLGEANADECRRSPPRDGGVTGNNKDGRNE
ncbi:hypothetical protein [Serratia rhizosphaerae]|uniref:hypothetical protein n=1 Tax=Serratia rhizosphaerae TaxID=2597702 RepID=UPI0019168117|nr:hypothetical protein [Serratia rhizosphaerae]